MLSIKHLFLSLYSGVLLFPSLAAAQICAPTDRPCVLKEIEAESSKVDNIAWRDQTYRELAKTYAFEGDTNKAMNLIDKIENPDTKAMTIRGIGMAVAELDLDKKTYENIFTALHEKAKTITHPPSYAIALTYIAMAQAFAGNDEEAWKTASEMENTALRNKAYGETAEIQAERKDFTAAMKSIGFIQSESYKNKAYSTVSKIFSNQTLYDEAIQTAYKITNPYNKAESLQYALDKQKPREQPLND